MWRSTLNIMRSHVHGMMNVTRVLESNGKSSLNKTFSLKSFNWRKLLQQINKLHDLISLLASQLRETFLEFIRKFLKFGYDEQITLSVSKTSLNRIFPSFKLGQNDKDSAFFC